MLIFQADLRDQSGEPDPISKLVMKHSGHSWEFWHGLVVVRQAAHAFGHREVLDYEVQRVLAEIEAAFRPVAQAERF